LIALVFGLSEGGMPLVGLLLGRQLSGGPAACSRQIAGRPGKKQLSDPGELLASAMLIVVGVVVGVT
jgi:hypothetical protein